MRTRGRRSSASCARGRCLPRAPGGPTKRRIRPRWPRWKPRSTAVAVAAPNPGRTDTFRRLNRTEYRNAIRDLLALDIDAAALLPSDSASYGFDNITVGNLSPTLLESYVAAAEKISQLAVGRPSLSPGGSTVRLRPDLTQETHLDGLPIGTRGGAMRVARVPRQRRIRHHDSAFARSE